MGYWTGRFSFGGSGSQIITCGNFQPTGCRVTVAGNGSTNKKQLSIGTADGTRQNCQFTNGSGSANTKIINLLDDSGNIVEDASWTAFGISGSTGRVTFNVGTVDTTLQHTLEVWN